MPDSEPLPDNALASTLRVKVYRYGSPLGTPPEGFALEQLFLQNRFWNDLVQIDHEFRDRYQAIVNNSDDKVKALNEQLANINARIEELRSQIKAQRKSVRSAKTPVESAREEIAVLNAERKSAYPELKRLKSEAKIRIKPQLHELDAGFKARAKSLRQQYAANGLYWGNYNAVWDSFMTARSRAMKEGNKTAVSQVFGPGPLDLPDSGRDEDIGRLFFG